MIINVFNRKSNNLTNGSERVNYYQMWYEQVINWDFIDCFWVCYEIIEMH